MAKAPKNNNESTPSRIENILAYMSVGVIGMSLISMIVALVSRLFANAAWPIFTQIPLIGLPFGFVLVLSLLVVSLIRRSKDARKN
jgi:hypothetical protein